MLRTFGEAWREETVDRISACPPCRVNNSQLWQINMCYNHGGSIVLVCVSATRNAPYCLQYGAFLVLLPNGVHLSTL
jgi:hypothetical protein